MRIGNRTFTVNLVIGGAVGLGGAPANSATPAPTAATPPSGPAKRGRLMAGNTSPPRVTRQEGAVATAPSISPSDGAGGIVTSLLPMLGSIG